MDGIRVCGIAGGSGAGKTTLTWALVETLAQEGRTATVLPFDNYYRDLADRPYPERTQVNFDHPDSL
ncbi:MAG: adenylyl-sulfate kinase, partial [Acidimicrobiales bacterium]